MQPSNANIASLLRRYASALALEGADRFRIKAYRRAAETLDTLPRSVSTLVAEGEDLRQLSGIGPAIKSAIEQIVRSGKLPQLDRVVSGLSPQLVELADWPGLDPRKILRIYKKLKIGSVQELQAALDRGLIHDALGSRMAFHVRQGLAKSPRILLWDALIIAEKIEEFLKTITGVSRVCLVGSCRRRRETVGDLNFLVACEDFQAVLRRSSEFGVAESGIDGPQDRGTFVLSSGARFEVRRTSADSWGFNQILATGSESHVREVTRYARGRRLHFAERSLRQAGIDITEEDSVYQGLSLPFIEPELREGLGEIDAASRDELPRLITLTDIQGDLHMHTVASDGANTIAEMAEAARQRGLKYIAITDHSQSLKITNGLSVDRLRRQMAEIDELNSELKGFRILKSAEVDILADGSLDYPDSVLQDLDLTICSIHSRFGLGKVQQTERLLRAMDNPYFSILGHATGRLLLKREGYEIDVDRIIDHAKANGCFFEINSSPDRLDLSDEHARRAKEAGVKIAINTDAHGAREFHQMAAGVNQARRAWLEASDVLNSLPVRALLKTLRRI